MKANRTAAALAAAALFGLVGTVNADTGSTTTGSTVKSGSNTVQVAKADSSAGTASGHEEGHDGKHDCKGKNECKGHGGCKTGDNGCKGKNSCKGKGGCKS